MTSVQRLRRHGRLFTLVEAARKLPARIGPEDIRRQIDQGCVRASYVEGPSRRRRWFLTEAQLRALIAQMERNEAGR